MSIVYFTSDLHFGHKNILKYRPIAETTEEHDNLITENILSILNKKDILWILGDVCFDMERWHYIEKIANYVGGLRIVLGNHDLEMAKAPKITDFIQLPNLRIFGCITYKDCWVTHMPINEEEFRNKKYNIHGHTHQYSIPDERYINVSLDVRDYKPISYENIKERYFTY